MAAPGLATDPRAAELAAEFRVLARYLGAHNVSDRLAGLYARMHAAVEGEGHPTGLDARLVGLARRSPFAAGLADAYARFARPYGTLRRKLTLTIALLESAAETHTAYDTALPATRVATWAALVGLGIAWALRTTLAVVVVGPLHLLSLRAPNEARPHG